jgi:ATP-dependent DNA helicase DinG
VDGIRRQFTRAKEELQLVIGGSQDNFLRWGSVSRGGARRGPSVTLNWTPIALGPLLGGSIWASGRTVGAALVSATLATDGGFHFLRERLGIAQDDPDVTETIVGSTFDYTKQCLLYVPRQMALPGDDPAYSDGVLEQIEALVTASQGGAFLLFTSHRALAMAHERLQELSLPFPLFRQGEMPNARLVEAFRQTGNGVLLGTFSFWEGVDVPGDVLRLVVIDRIPFAMPDSPLHRARVDKITAEGGDWFGEYALPQAEIRLKQGFGRLIRSSADRGVVAILDARLFRKNYGARILASLPPAPRTPNIDVVRDFYAGPVKAPPAAEAERALAEG